MPIPGFDEPTTMTQAQRWAAYQECFNTPAGQLVLEDMQNAHHMYSTTAGNGPVDPYQMAIKEGGRNAVLRIMAILDTKESDYVR